MLEFHNNSVNIHVNTAEFRMKRKICSNIPHHAEFNAEFHVVTEYWSVFPHLDCGIPHEAENLFQCSKSSRIFNAEFRVDTEFRIHVES